MVVSPLEGEGAAASAIEAISARPVRVSGERTLHALFGHLAVLFWGGGPMPNIGPPTPQRSRQEHFAPQLQT